MVLTEKEAFQMILDTIFKSDESMETVTHQCTANEDPKEIARRREAA